MRANKKTTKMMMNQKMPTHQVAPIHELLLAVLLLYQSVQRLKKWHAPCFFNDVSPQVRLASFERCVHKFPDFPKRLSFSE